MGELPLAHGTIGWWELNRRVVPPNPALLHQVADALKLDRKAFAESVYLDNLLAGLPAVAVFTLNRLAYRMLKARYSETAGDRVTFTGPRELAYNIAAGLKLGQLAARIAEDPEEDWRSHFWEEVTEDNFTRHIDPATVRRYVFSDATSMGCSWAEGRVYLWLTFLDQGGREQEVAEPLSSSEDLASLHFLEKEKRREK